MSIFESSAIIESYLQDVIENIISCCTQMKVSYQNNGQKLPNLEDPITNTLVEEFLKQDRRSYFRYETQSKEGYDINTHMYRGCADIRVLRGNQFSSFDGYYYIIECKRIDGTGSKLNQEYVKNGVHRFFANPPHSLSPPPKYRSPYHENIMLGYVVKQVDIDSNARKIEKIQCSYLNKYNVVPGKLELKNSLDAEYFDYCCTYQSKVDENEKPEILRHVFYNLSSIIQ